jgi:hypothetical protein
MLRSYREATQLVVTRAVFSLIELLIYLVIRQTCFSEEWGLSEGQGLLGFL